MFEVGDAVLLPPEFGSGKKGVLVRRESNGIWLVQIGTSGYEFLPEQALRPLAQRKKCWRCGAPLNPLTPDCADLPKCPACGAYDRRKQGAEK